MRRTLDEAQVRIIRRRAWDRVSTQRELARAFGVSESCVSRIVNGLRWKHVP